MKSFFSKFVLGLAAVIAMAVAFSSCSDEPKVPDSSDVTVCPEGATATLFWEGDEGVEAVYVNDRRYGSYGSCAVEVGTGVIMIAERKPGAGPFTTPSYVEFFVTDMKPITVKFTTSRH